MKETIRRLGYLVNVRRGLEKRRRSRIVRQLLYLEEAGTGDPVRVGDRSAVAQKRELFRVAIDRTGQVQRGAELLPCQVVDLTEKGFRLQLEGVFAVGEVLHLEFALSERDLLACTVQVTYVRAPFLGAVIAGISPDHQTRLSRFIDQVNALNMTGI